MKSFNSLLAIAGLFCLLSLTFAAANKSARAGEPISLKEYDAFHELLHPLEHDALPKKDFSRIRAQAANLVKRGKAIVKLGVPAGTAEKNVTEFRRELRKFSDALKKFGRDAKTGSDADLEASFSAVHDRFEVLAGMLPQK